MNQVKYFNANVEKFGDRDFLRANGKGYTWSEIGRMSESAAGFFQQRGIRSGDRVAIMSQNTVSFVVAYFGVLMAGGVVVPVNHKLMAPEVDYVLGNSGAKLYLFDGTLSEVAEKTSSRAGKLAMEKAAAGFEFFDALLVNSAAFSPVLIEDDAAAQILYTSGTTGKPKGCVITHASTVLNGLFCALLMKMDEGSRLLMAMPIWHSSPLNNWFAGVLVVGGTVVLLREYHPLHFLEAVQNEKCTIFFGSPISYILPLHLPNFDSFDLSSMQTWIYGGGPISGETAKKIMSRYKSDKFYQVYGMTETGPTGMVLPPGDQLRKPASIGRTGNPGVNVKVMKTENRQAGPGETGEIWLQSECAMKGYYENPAATAEVFSEDGWYKSGDLARVDEDGYLYIVDRSKDMIVTGGENVYSREVEDVICACPGVQEAAVIGVPHPDWGETVVAIVVGKIDFGLDEGQIKAFLSDKLAGYKIPKVFRFVESLPRTPSGKAMKYKLRETFKQEQIDAKGI
ncbi:MAG: class I adenylate-forming enzyme family protein [Syntrophobacteraceae bacterium]|nr:class I adenylate-forming enzyme family protein [Syntrophobacteraceae bacterium]